MGFCVPVELAACGSVYEGTTVPFGLSLTGLFGGRGLVAFAWARGRGGL